jgi:tetratricopeptide (TPR) repeat protein
MDQARYVLEHIESENKTNPAVYYFLGILSKKQGRLTESYRFFEKSKMLDNNYWFADHELKAIREAEIERLEQSLDQDGSAEKYLEYADLLRMTGQYKKALTVLIECKDAGYTNAEFSDSMKKTIDLYEQDLERDLEGDTPTRQTFMDLGEIYVHKKRFTEAFTIFQTAVSLYPKDKELSSFYGFLIKKNIEVYEGMLKTQESTMVYYNLAVMYALSDRKQEMFTALDKAIRRDKKLAMQARYEDAFKPFRDQDRFRLVTLIEGEDKNIYRMQD